MRGPLPSGTALDLEVLPMDVHKIAALARVKAERGDGA
jgi:hypothetical protein